MNSMNIVIAAAALAGALVATWAGLSAATSLADPIGRLTGRWSGPGTLVPATGPNQPFDCVVTYMPQPANGVVKQTLRCKGGDYKFEAATNLQFQGDKIAGRWEDKINSIDGTVEGKVTDTGFEVDLKGRFFEAKMAVAGSDCQQTVKVQPHHADYIRELSAALKKC